MQKEFLFVGGMFDGYRLRTGGQSHVQMLCRDKNEIESSYVEYRLYRFLGNAFYAELGMPIEKAIGVLIAGYVNQSASSVD